MRGETWECGASGSTASAMPGPAGGPSSSSETRRGSPPGDGPPRRGRVAGGGRPTAGRSTPPWASRPSRAWSWRRVRGASTPGVLLWLLRHAQVTVDELEDTLDRRSGLLGLSGVSGRPPRRPGRRRRGRAERRPRLRRLPAPAAGRGGRHGRCHGGIDGLVFTGGAGEGSARLRGDVCAGLGFLGLSVDDDAKRALFARRGDLGASGTVAPAVAVVRSREDVQIARSVRAVLAAGS